MSGAFNFVDNIVSSALLSAQIATCFKLGGQQTLTSNITSGNDNYMFFGTVPSKYAYISNVTSDIQNQINNKQNIGNYSTIDNVNSISSKIYLNYITSSTLNNNLLNYPTNTTLNNNLAYHYLYQTSISSNFLQTILQVQH